MLSSPPLGELSYRTGESNGKCNGQCSYIGVIRGVEGLG